MENEKENGEMNFIERIIAELQKDIGNKPNEAYLSESDFQFEFANKAKALGAEKFLIELPYVFDGDTTRKRIDVYFEYEGTKYYVELKYKTCLFKDLTRYGMKTELPLANQSAENDAMFAFREDVERMEKLLLSKSGESVKAYCVFLSNYHGFWERHLEGSVISSVQLSDEIKAEHLKYKNEKSTDISNVYSLVWKDFKKLGAEQVMRYLIVECKPKN